MSDKADIERSLQSGGVTLGLRQKSEEKQQKLTSVVWSLVDAWRTEDLEALSKEEADAPLMAYRIEAAHEEREQRPVGHMDAVRRAMKSVPRRGAAWWWIVYAHQEARSNGWGSYRVRDLVAKAFAWEPEACKDLGKVWGVYEPEPSERADMLEVIDG